MYSLKLIKSSPDLEVWYLRNSLSFCLLLVSSWMPNLRFLLNCSQNFLKSSAFSLISWKSSRHFFVMFFLMTLRILLCWRYSLEMLRGRSSESTTPLMKPRYSGMSSSQSSMMKTLRTQSLMLFFFFLVSNMSKGARLGTKMIDLNSRPPSTENCLTAKWSYQSLVRLLQKLEQSSLETSSGFFIQMGLFLLSSSNSVETSLIFFFFFSSFLSSLISTSPSFFYSSSSSSETSFSVVFSTCSEMGNEMNSECFFTKSLSFLSSKNSTLSVLIARMTFEPLEIFYPSSSTTENVPPAVDSHLH